MEMDARHRVAGSGAVRAEVDVAVLVTLDAVACTIEKVLLSALVPRRMMEEAIAQGDAEEVVGPEGEQVPEDVRQADEGRCLEVERAFGLAPSRFDLADPAVLLTGVVVADHALSMHS